MIYIDAGGNVSPCVFLPVSFGNIMRRSVREIYADMKRRFPTENRCFINENYRLLEKNYRDCLPLTEGETLAMMKEVTFAPMARFFQLHRG